MLHLDGAERAVFAGQGTFQDMINHIQGGEILGQRDVERIIRSHQDRSFSQSRERSGGGNSEDWSDMPSPRFDGPLLAGKVRALTKGQTDYIEAIRGHDVVFAVGPAGCGKTYLAVAAAVDALAKHQVNRLILVRPAVEAGEHLGFLPGDMQEKVNPYLRPIYDALYDVLNPAQVARFMEREVIEIAPLAFMRGRTLNNAYVILDEAQNTTPKQMKMFLTRLGRSAKAVVTGDVTQVDLADGARSGLAHACEVLKNLDGVKFINLERQDIVRHPLVQRIVDAYEKNEHGSNGRVDET